MSWSAWDRVCFCSRWTRREQHPGGTTCLGTATEEPMTAGLRVSTFPSENSVGPLPPARLTLYTSHRSLPRFRRLLSPSARSRSWPGYCGQSRETKTRSFSVRLALQVFATATDIFCTKILWTFVSSFRLQILSCTIPRRLKRTTLVSGRTFGPPSWFTLIYYCFPWGPANPRPGLSETFLLFFFYFCATGRPRGIIFYAHLKLKVISCAKSQLGFSIWLQNLERQSVLTVSVVRVIKRRFADAHFFCPSGYLPKPV